MVEMSFRSPVNRKKEYIVSACLVGKCCVYDGSSNLVIQIKELMDSGRAVALCPEELAGLKTPRPTAEIFNGSGEDVLKGKAYIFNKEGKDITINIIKGSREFLNIAKEYAIKKAILKTRSPCCGKGKIYDGTFSNRLRKGNGVTTALLLKNGVEVITDEEFLRPNKKYIKKKNYGKEKRPTRR